MATKEQVDAAKAEADAALAVVNEARAAKNEAQAAVDAAQAHVRSVLPAYDEAHNRWAALRKEYLAAAGADAAQTLGGN